MTHGSHSDHVVNDFLIYASSNLSYIPVRRDFIRSGVLTKIEALFLSDLINLYSMDVTVKSDDGYFLCTAAYMDRSLSWGRMSQTDLFRSLKDKGFIETSFRGIPRRRWVKIDVVKLEEAIRKNLEVLNQEIVPREENDDDRETSNTDIQSPGKPVVQSPVKHGDCPPGNPGDCRQGNPGGKNKDLKKGERTSSATADSDALSPPPEPTRRKKIDKDERHDGEVRNWSIRLKEAYHRMGFIATKYQKNVIKDLLILRDEDGVPATEIERIVAWLETLPVEELKRAKLRNPTLGQFYAHFSWFSRILDSSRETDDDDTPIEELIERDRLRHYTPPEESPEPLEELTDEEFERITGSKVYTYDDEKPTTKRTKRGKKDA